MVHVSLSYSPWLDGLLLLKLVQHAGDLDPGVEHLSSLGLGVGLEV